MAMTTIILATMVPPTMVIVITHPSKQPRLVIEMDMIMVFRIANRETATTTTMTGDTVTGSVPTVTLIAIIVTHTREDTAKATTATTTTDTGATKKAEEVTI